MPTTPAIKVVFEGADEWLRENGADLTSDTVCACRPHEDESWKPGESMRYRDLEEDTEKVCSWADHVKALELLADQIGRRFIGKDGKECGLFVGGIKHPSELLDPRCWDAEVTDAFWQLVYRGEVIYG